MGVYIKGMEIPKSCLDCKVHYVWGSGRPQCLINGEFIDDPNAYKQKRLEECPLIPVPDHGRLIDADALTREQGFHDYKYVSGLVYVSVCEVVGLINAAPAIIPADREGEA